MNFRTYTRVHTAPPKHAQHKSYLSVWIIEIGKVLEQAGRIHKMTDVFVGLVHVAGERGDVLGPLHMAGIVCKQQAHEQVTHMQPQRVS